MTYASEILFISIWHACQYGTDVRRGDLHFRIPPFITSVLYEKVVPESDDRRGRQMPQRMCVDIPSQRRKVKQLQRSRTRRKSDEQRGLPSVRRAVLPCAGGEAVYDRKPRGERKQEPEDVVRHADDEVRRHIVRVVEAGEQGQVADVCEERYGAHKRQTAADDLSFGGVRRRRLRIRRRVEVEQADGGVVERVHNRKGRREVVQLLG